MMGAARPNRLNARACQCAFNSRLYHGPQIYVKIYYLSLLRIFSRCAVPKQPQDFTRPPARASRPGPEPDDDDPFDWGPEDENSEGCLGSLLLVAGFFLLFFIGDRLGFGWFSVLPGLVLVGVMGWFVVGHFAAESLKELTTLPSTLLMLYGAVAVVSPVSAVYLVPESWAWPLPAETRVQVLPDGRRVADTESAGRLQVYDADGNYLNGWFIPSHGGHYQVLGPDLTVGENTILVYAVRADKGLILYDPEGRVLREQGAPNGFKARPQGHFETMSFQTPWYLWPLARPIHGWVTMMAGFFSMGAIQFLLCWRLTDGDDEEDDEAQPADRGPEVSRRTFLVCLGLLSAGMAGVALAWRRFDLDLEIMSMLVFFVIWAVIFGACVVTSWNSGYPTARTPRKSGSASRPPGRGVGSNQTRPGRERRRP